MRVGGAVLAVVVMAAGVGVAPSAQAARVDKDCGDFPSQKAAQIFYLNNNPAADPHRLDADGDGVVCESNPGPYYFGSNPNPGGGGTPAPAPPKKDKTIRVVKVVNGQLVKVRQGKKPAVVVRLLGVSIPKRSCEAKAAVRDLRDWVKPGMKVKVHLDKKAPNRDGKGRMLRYLSRVKGNYDIGGSQIDTGFADVDRSIRFSFKKKYLRWESKAAGQSLGYHGTCP